MITGAQIGARQEANSQIIPTNSVGPSCCFELGIDGKFSRRGPFPNATR